MKSNDAIGEPHTTRDVVFMGGGGGGEGAAAASVAY